MTLPMVALTRISGGVYAIYGLVDPEDARPEQADGAAALSGSVSLPKMLIEIRKKHERRPEWVYSYGLLRPNHWESVRARLEPWMHASFEDKHLVSPTFLTLHPIPTWYRDPDPATQGAHEAAWRTWVTGIRDVRRMNGPRKTAYDLL